MLKFRSFFFMPPPTVIIKTVSLLFFILFFIVLPFSSSLSSSPPTPSSSPSLDAIQQQRYASAISVWDQPGSLLSVECTEPLTSSASVWKCGIGQNVAGGGGAEEEPEGEWRKSGEGEEGEGTATSWSSSGSGSREGGTGRGRRRRLFHAGPLELYYSNKVNQSDGRLFISALARWQFRSATPYHSYRIHLWIREMGGGGGQKGASGGTSTGTESSPDPEGEGEGENSLRQFVIPLALAVGDGTGTSSSKSAAGSKSGERNGGGQKVQLLVHIDALFQFGNTYEIKILCMADTGQQGENGANSTVGKIPGPNFAMLGTSFKRMEFAELFDELDTEGCPAGEDGQPEKAETPRTALTRRRAMASRWTGSLHSVSFFPLHAAINVSFFGAPPSHCIPAYRVQLWLLNALQDEQIVKADQLVRTRPNVYIGSAEFRDMLRGERMKYRVKLLPVEQSHGVCVCELERKCGCVQVYSDPFLLLNSSSSSSDLPSSTVSSSPPLPPLPSGPSSSSVLLLLLAGLFLTFTLILLSSALLLLIVRHSSGDNSDAHRKRRTLLIFRKYRRDEDVLLGLKKSCSGDQAGHDAFSSSGGSRKEVQSVLLINAQPSRRGELERFARVLVKNGVRVFYDRWDRSRIERNLLQWVQHAVAKSHQIVLFYDRRAEQLLGTEQCYYGGGQQEDLFDQVFRALHQHLDTQKTIFVKWDESRLVDGRPLSVMLSECVFLFRRDLRHIFAALHVPVTDAELREIEREHAKASTGQPSGGMVVDARRPKLDRQMLEEEGKKLMDEEEEEEGRRNKMEGMKRKEEDEEEERRGGKDEEDMKPEVKVEEKRMEGNEDEEEEEDEKRERGKDEEEMRMKEEGEEVEDEGVGTANDGSETSRTREEQEEEGNSGRSPVAQKGKKEGQQQGQQQQQHDSGIVLTSAN